jgi:hypothetical protein
MNVMEGTRKQDCIKLASIKVWPGRYARVHAQSQGSVD